MRRPKIGARFWLGVCVVWLLAGAVALAGLALGLPGASVVLLTLVAAGLYRLGGHPRPGRI